MVQKPPLCLGGGGLGVRGWRGACGLGATPFMPGHGEGNCTMRGARSSPPHVEGASKRGELHQ